MSLDFVLDKSRIMKKEGEQRGDKEEDEVEMGADGERRKKRKKNKKLWRRRIGEGGEKKKTKHKGKEK